MDVLPAEVSNLLASLGHTGRNVILGHTLNTLQHIITKKSHNVLSKFMILCWATFIAILGCLWPMGLRLDTPEIKEYAKVEGHEPRHSGWKSLLATTGMLSCCLVGFWLAGPSPLVFMACGQD